MAMGQEVDWSGPIEEKSRYEESTTEATTEITTEETTTSS
jgi:hypothetical protein